MTPQRIGIPQLIGIGIANGILIGGALATAHRGRYLAVAIATGIFITFTYVMSCRWSATKP